MEITAEPRAELKMCIENFWNTLPKSGTYFTGTERVMIAHEVRAARSCPLSRTLAAQQQFDATPSPELF